MADEQKPKERRERKKVGNMAPAAGVEPAPAPARTESTKRPKLQKKNKSRLPRRQKKARQKAAAAQSAV